MTLPAASLPPSLTLPPGLHVGSKGPAVKLIQEWLNFHGETVAIDGDFGPKTATALDLWRRDFGNDADGPLTALDCDRLKMPMTNALAAADKFQDSIVDIARGYLDAGAREIGGNNRGPWVRLFTGGFDGDGYLWCGYFTRHVARQAGHPWAERISPSCDVTVANAIKDSRLRPAGERPQVGDLFVRYRFVGAGSERDYYHQGIVTDAFDVRFATIEGNSNTDGSANGDRVVALSRGYARTVFVRMGA